jgi:argininosuccinate lyase
MPLWEGRFSGKTDPQFWALNASLPFDQRLAQQDVRGSLAWAAGLARAGVLSTEEHQRIVDGLAAIMDEFSSGRFAFAPGDEDIHTAVERRLGELAGQAAGKLHSGRSRNDQVATDLRLWLMDQVPGLQQALSELQSALLDRAEEDEEVLMPGYTHLQRAQPILLSHWWLAHFWPLQRDQERLHDLHQRLAVLPLGAAALAGTAFPVDRAALASDLGFASASPNSLDAVSDRDFAAEFLFWAALCGVHLSRLAEALVLFNSAEFGYIQLADAYATGSSLMPQKKNPDAFELARGKAGSLIGALCGLLAALKGLPSAYDKDLQEDKIPLFTACDTLLALLPVLAGAIRTLRVDPGAMRAGITAGMLATDLADELVRRGVPFREAHHLVGRAVALADELGVPLDQLDQEQLLGIHPAFDFEVGVIFDPQRSLRQREVFGGTGPQAVLQQIELARASLLPPPVV